MSDFPDQLEHGDYHFVKELEKGGQGTVCLYQHKLTKQHFAVKFDPKDNKNSNVLTECLFLKEHSVKLTRIPKYILHSTIKSRRYLIMEYLDSSLEEYIVS